MLIPADLEPQKIVGSAVYGGSLVAVQGSYDDVNRLASELADEREDWAFVNVNVRPYYAEGSKTIGFEIAEQLGWRLPEQIVVPVASGAQLVKIDKAFRELIATGLVDEAPYRVFGAQATGCSPVAAAFRAGHDVVQPVRPATIAKSLAIGNPADGPYVLDVVRRTGGAVADVSDDELVDAIRLLAADRGHLRRDCGRRHPGRAAQAAEGRPDRPGRRDRHHQLRRRAQDARCRGGNGSMRSSPIRPTLEAFAARESPRARARRQAKHDRVRSHPHDPAQLHRRRPLWSPAGPGPCARSSPGSTPTTRASAAGCSTTPGKLRRFVNVYVGDEDVRLAQGLDTPVPVRGSGLGDPGGRRRLSLLRGLAAREPGGRCTARSPRSAHCCRDRHKLPQLPLRTM